MTANPSHNAMPAETTRRTPPAAAAPELTVRLPEEPPHLTETAAAALLRFVRDEYHRLMDTPPVHTNP
ncbi:hypothetical protein K2224_37355 (plasmid) [Streptomyces sp. BHT-5-2]|uniref:hypothetical protein n=1 Tax=Streptomyces sp. BHT-5-2 TaxID=2866715 RepID=UPI001C8E9E2F|nr:hypothetical protein [Streptomyces sp. BHT-5-2]QZL08720.1 hypothetical protein K2224_37355 [Streptomyces sp. BHT-5-2]